MKPAAGVVPAAFDTALIGTSPSDFVYRDLDNTVTRHHGRHVDAVDQSRRRNGADEPHRAKQAGPRQRREMGVGDDVAARRHESKTPRAIRTRDKVWTFGSYKQRLTDAVNFYDAGRRRPSA